MIIEYDFGKKQRPASKRFWKPTGGEAPAAIRPIRSTETPLERANARIAQLEAALRGAHAAGAGPDDVGQALAARGQILVDAAEYARLLRCRELVAAALADA